MPDMTDLPGGKQLRGIVAVMGLGLLVLGGGWFAKGYFDDMRHDLLCAIQPVAAQVQKHEEQIEQVKRYYWSKADQQRYMQQFDRINRTLVPGLLVPDVPAPGP